MSKITNPAAFSGCVGYENITDPEAYVAQLRATKEAYSAFLRMERESYPFRLNEESDNEDSTPSSQVSIPSQISIESSGSSSDFSQSADPSNSVSISSSVSSPDLIQLSSTPPPFPPLPERVEQQPTVPPPLPRDWILSLPLPPLPPPPPLPTWPPASLIKPEIKSELCGRVTFSNIKHLAATALCALLTIVGAALILSPVGFGILVGSAGMYLLMNLIYLCKKGFSSDTLKTAGLHTLIFPFAPLIFIFLIGAVVTKKVDFNDTESDIADDEPSCFNDEITTEEEISETAQEVSPAVPQFVPY